MAADLRGWTRKGRPDLTQMMLVMHGDLVEFLPQRAHAIDVMHELQVAAAVVVLAGIIDDSVANRFVHTAGDIQRHARVVEAPRPGILIHHPYQRTRLAEHPTDAIEEDGLAIGEVMQDVGDGPFARRVSARQVRAVEREALQRLVPSPFQLLNKVRAPSSRLLLNAVMQLHQPILEALDGM